MKHNSFNLHTKSNLACHSWIQGVANGACALCYHRACKFTTRYVYPLFWQYVPLMHCVPLSRPWISPCCLLLPPAASCCPLLPPAASCCLLLPPAASCCLMLPRGSRGSQMGRVPFVITGHVNLPHVMCTPFLAVCPPHALCPLVKTLDLPLLPPAASCCLLLPPAASCCLLLPPAASCCLLLPPAASCCLLLPPAASCCLLLPPAAPCCPLLPPAAPCCLLLPPAAKHKHKSCRQKHNKHVTVSTSWQILLKSLKIQL